MRWLLKISPQGHRISEPGLCVGIRFASFPHRILTRRPIPLVAPRLKIGLPPVRQEHPPRLLEISAGPVERGRGAVGAFSRMGAGTEAAGPAPGSSPGGMPVRSAIVPTRTSP